MAEIPTLQVEQVTHPLRQAVREFADLIWRVTDGRALGLTLFGGVVRGPFDPARQPLRSVLVLDEVDLSALRRLAEEGLRLGRSNFAAPLIMTPSYIQASLDTFPLELIEIQQAHITIMGRHFFQDLTFDPQHVRLQCERELKVLLIAMRQGLLAAAGREDLLAILGADAGEGLLRTLRGALWARGQRGHQPAAQVIAEVESWVGLPLDGVRQTLDGSGSDPWQQFQQLYREIAHLGKIVDG